MCWIVHEAVAMLVLIGEYSTADDGLATLTVAVCSAGFGFDFEALGFTAGFWGCAARRWDRIQPMAASWIRLGFASLPIASY